MSITVNTPVAPFTLSGQSTQLLPSGQNGVNEHESEARQRPGHTAAAAFAQHAPAADGAKTVSQAAARAGTPGPNTIKKSDANTEIDAMAAVERIAAEWEKAGVDPAWIKVIKEPGIWHNAFEQHLPAINKLGEDLQRTGEFQRLRSQAIRITRGTQAWRDMLDNRVSTQTSQAILDGRAAPEPGLLKMRVEHHAVAELFGWRKDMPSDNTRVLHRIINARPIADKQVGVPAEQPPLAGAPPIAIAA